MFNSKRLVALLLLWLWVCPSTAFAALSGSTIWEVETGGSDTLNGGAFDPSQTAGMNTDGAATSATGTAPVFTSASYNFVAGDVGAWIYIASGTNWTAGWYKISLVASNAATLNATIGQAVLKAGTPTTAAGCATTASPTSATWTIDYSQQSSAQFAYTDLVSAGTGLTVSSVAHPFGKQQVGNSLVVTGGTNFNLGRFVLASIGALNVATVIGPTNITTGAGASGTGGLGGALVSPGQSTASAVAGNTVFIQTGTYPVTTATQAVSGGTMKPNSNGSNFALRGYGVTRGDLASPPTIQLGSGVSSATILQPNSYLYAENLVLDCNAQTASLGVSLVGNAIFLYKITVKNAVTGGFNLSSATNGFCLSCVATGCAGYGFSAAVGQVFMLCEAYSNTAIGFQTTGAYFCLSYNNTGSTTDGFQGSCLGCVAYNNGRDGFGSGQDGAFVNCIAEGNARYGFNQRRQSSSILNCATYNNTSGNNLSSPVPVGPLAGITPLSVSAFINASGTNFGLNNTAGGGALCRALGIPGKFPVASTTGYQDIGAAQSQCTSGSSTSSVGCGIIGQIQQEMRRRAIQEAAFAHNTRMERKWGFADKLPRPDLKWPLAIFGLAGWGGLVYVRLKK